jgi:serine/threonine protein kinase
MALRDPAAAQSRPLPLRTYSESETAATIMSGLENYRAAARSHSRHQSMTANLSKLVVPSTDQSHVGVNVRARDSWSHAPRAQIDASSLRVSTSALTPPATPGKAEFLDDHSSEEAPEILDYDFSKLDYELDRAKLLGTGLWSDVYLAEPTAPQNNQPNATTLLTPPATPQKVPQSVRPSLYAVKLPTRPDAYEVFRQEAKVLTHIHRHSSSETYIVPFHGFDPRNSALVFAALQAGSLHDLTCRMAQMTELCRHQELVTLFPSLASDLISGLDFLHNTAGVVHADIKPANILLSASPRHPKKLQARYADFSASFLITSPDSPTSPSTSTSTVAGGGTWTYLAPEILRLSPPTPASDVWSLGLTFLSLIILGSPYSAACGDNLFSLREGIKNGDPLGFAAMDPAARKRMVACQGFVDCCRLALQKDVGRRVGAEGWKGWVGRQGWRGNGRGE